MDPAGQDPTGQDPAGQDPAGHDVGDRHAWERPGAFEVLPGVHRIPLPLPGDNLKAVNVYAIADGARVVLVDGGWAMADASDVLARGLAAIGYQLADIGEFLVTHMHRDHYTQAVALRRAVGASVSLGEGERAALDLIRSRRLPPMAQRMRAAGADALAERLADWNQDAELTDWEYPNTWLADGADIALSTRRLRVIATPGHTRGHVVFHDPQHDALFAGDHVLPHITPSIGVEPNRPPSPLRDFLSSLELIRALPDATLLPAHGPVAASVHDRIDELLAHHADRLDATAEAVDQGAATSWEVALALPWTRHKRALIDLDVFNQVLAVQETAAHLTVLADRGWLRETEQDGVQHFRRA